MTFHWIDKFLSTPDAHAHYNVKNCGHAPDPSFHGGNAAVASRRFWDTCQLYCV